MMMQPINPAPICSTRAFLCKLGDMTCVFQRPARMNSGRFIPGIGGVNGIDRVLGQYEG